MALSIERVGWKKLTNSSSGEKKLVLKPKKLKKRKRMTIEQQKLLSRLIAFWRDLYFIFFGLSRIRIDHIDIRILKTIIDKYEDEKLICGAMMALFDTCRFDEYYASRRIYPKIPSLSKNWNRFASMYLGFDIDIVDRFRKWRKVFEALKMVPTVRLKRDWIPFGLDIPENIKGNGFSMSCVYELDGRDAVLVDRNGKKKIVRMYAHYCFKNDPVTGRLIDIGEKYVVKVTPLNFEQYWGRWFDKTLAEVKDE